MLDQVKVLINKKEFVGWQSMSLSRSISGLATSFNLQATDSWSDKNTVRFLPQDTIEIYINSKKVLTGFLDSYSTSIGTQGRSISLSGRSLTGDLVDSSHIGQSEFSSVSLEGLVRKLCEPFGIELASVEVDTGANISNLKIESGVSVFEVLKKEGAKKGFLFHTNVDGQIEILKIGERRAALSLVEGKNLISSSIQMSTQDRFSDYIVKGSAGAGKEIKPYKIKDSEFSRYRPKVIKATGKSDRSILKKRAEWEVEIRKAKSSSINVSIPNWFDDDGNLIEENTIVNFVSPMSFIDEDLLVTSVNYSLSTSGQSCSLELIPPNAFIQQPVAVGTSKSSVPQQIPIFELGPDGRDVLKGFRNASAASSSPNPITSKTKEKRDEGDALNSRSED